MVLSDLVPDVCGRVEENLPTASFLPGPTFWNLVGEFYPQMVYAMFEATLLTGVVQVSNRIVTLPAGVTYFTIPKGMIATLRLRAPYPIRKATMKGLDDMIPNWQNVDPSDQIQCWFPLGVSMFGIFPQLSAESDVTMDFIQSPVNQARPYSGAIAIPFQTEFNDAFGEYTAAMLRAKEGGAEAEEASVVYQEYLANMKALSSFQSRLDSLVMSGAYGGKVGVNDRKVV